MKLLLTLHNSIVSFSSTLTTTHGLATSSSIHSRPLHLPPFRLLGRSQNETLQLQRNLPSTANATLVLPIRTSYNNLQHACICTGAKTERDQTVQHQEHSHGEWEIPRASGGCKGGRSRRGQGDQLCAQQCQLPLVNHITILVQLYSTISTYFSNLESA